MLVLFHLSQKCDNTDPLPVQVYLTSNLNLTEAITSVDKSREDGLFSCSYIQLDIAHLTNQTVYVNGFISWVAGYLEADKLTSWVASPNSNQIFFSF